MKNYYQHLPSEPPYLLLSGLIIFWFILDQFSKYWFSQNLTDPIVITSWLRLVLEKNTGIAFSIAIPYLILIILNALLFLILAVFLLKKLDWSKLLSVLTFTAFLAGGLGNLTDRIRLGYVVDFISVGNFPVFNLADSLITVSVFFLLLFYDKINRSTKEKSYAG